MAVMNIERAVEETARATSRLAEPHLRSMQRYLEESHRRISDQLRRGWPSSLPIESRLFREARAREILAQLNPTLDTLRLGTAGHPLTAEMRQMILAGHKTAVPTSFYKRLAAAAPARWGANLTAAQAQELVQFGVAVDVTAVEAQVRNLSALGRLAEAGVLDPQTIAEAEARTRNAMFRLGRYGEQAIDGVNQAVVDGMVQGKGWRSVAREVRGAILGDPHAPGTKGGLAFRAETVARTEMMSAGNESRTQHYRDNGISQVIWMATADERTCEYCGGRSGNIYDLDKTVVPAHPRCRCVISPFRKEWMDEGIITEEMLDGHADDVLKEYRSATGDPTAVFPTRAPSVFEKSAGLTQAVGPIRRAGTLAGGPPPPAPPLGEAEAREAIYSQADRLHPSMSAAERKAMETWHLEMGEEANEYLRGQIPYAELDGRLKPMIRGMDSAFANPHARLSHDMTLWRGYSLPSNRIPRDPSKMVGTTIRDTGFKSTSAKQSVAERFRFGGQFFDDGEDIAMLLEIRAKAGTRGLSIGRGSLDEIVLPRNARFQVVSAVRDKGANSLRLVVDIVEEAAPAPARAAAARAAPRPRPVPAPAPASTPAAGGRATHFVPLEASVRPAETAAARVALRASRKPINDRSVRDWIMHNRREINAGNRPLLDGMAMIARRL